MPTLSGIVPVKSRTRFAPSVTGHLHLGHLVNAIHVWGLARTWGAEVALRLEDHDRRRFRPEYESSILDDLDWLGLAPDLGRTFEFRTGSTPWRQSSATARYDRALVHLAERGLVYACDCSRAAVGTEAAPGEEPRYAGTCRDRGLPFDGHRLRVRLDPGSETFDDLRLGRQEQRPDQQCGDFAIRDANGDWTYQFAVTVDDMSQEISLVIRGEDLLASTGRQIRLARLLGRDRAPAYYHHPLVVGADGRKLSKREFAKGIGDLRAEGRSPGSVLGEAAYLGGLIARPRPLAVEETPGLFR